MRVAEQNRQLAAPNESYTAILIDLLRRSGQVEQARQIIAARRDDITDEMIRQIIDFQVKLLDRNDVSCHTVEEVIGK